MNTTKITRSRRISWAKLPNSDQLYIQLEPGISPVHLVDVYLAGELLGISPDSFAELCQSGAYHDAIFSERGGWVTTFHSICDYMRDGLAVPSGMFGPVSPGDGLVQ